LCRRPHGEAWILRPPDTIIGAQIASAFRAGIDPSRPQIETFSGAPVLSPDRDRPFRHHGRRLHGESWRTSVAQIPARRIASGRAADRDHEFEKQDVKLSRRAFHRRGGAMYETTSEGPGAMVILDAARRLPHSPDLIGGAYL
jgi:hypothetical protein